MEPETHISTKRGPRWMCPHCSSSTINRSDRISRHINHFCPQNRSVIATAISSLDGIGSSSLQNPTLTILAVTSDPPSNDPNYNSFVVHDITVFRSDEYSRGSSFLPINENSGEDPDTQFGNGEPVPSSFSLTVSNEDLSLDGPELCFEDDYNGSELNQTSTIHLENRPFSFLEATQSLTPVKRNIATATPLSAPVQSDFQPQPKLPDRKRRMFAIISSSDGDTEKSNLMQIDTPRTKEKEPELDSFAEITQSSIVGTSDELPVSFLNDNDQVLPIIPLDSSLEAIEASIEAPVSCSLIRWAPKVLFLSTPFSRMEMFCKT